MKSTGIVRRIDDLGRVVIPKEIRRTLGVKEGDPLEIGVDGDKVVLWKYFPSDTTPVNLTGEELEHLRLHVSKEYGAIVPPDEFLCELFEKLNAAHERFYP